MENAYNWKTLAQKSTIVLNFPFISQGAWRGFGFANAVRLHPVAAISHAIKLSTLIGNYSVTKILTLPCICVDPFLWEVLNQFLDVETPLWWHFFLRSVKEYIIDRMMPQRYSVEYTDKTTCLHGINFLPDAVTADETLASCSLLSGESGFASFGVCNS